MKYIRYLVVFLLLMTIDSCSSFNHVYYVADDDSGKSAALETPVEIRQDEKNTEQDKKITALEDKVKQGDEWRVWVKDQFTRILSQRDDVKSKTMLRVIKGCPPPHYKTLPPMPPLPTARFNQIQPDDKDAIINLEADQVDALRRYIENLKSQITTEQSEYLRSCTK